MFPDTFLIYFKLYFIIYFLIYNILYFISYVIIHFILYYLLYYILYFKLYWNIFKQPVNSKKIQHIFKKYKVIRQVYLCPEASKLIFDEIKYISKIILFILLKIL